MKRKFLKELLLIPFLIFLFTLILDSMRSTNINSYFIISDYFLTESTIVFDEMKTMFTAFLLVTSFELLLYHKVKENFMISKIVSLMLMLLFILFLFNVIFNFYNKLLIYLIRIGIIYIGTISYLIMEKRIIVKRYEILSTILLFILTSFFVFYRYL